MFSIFKSRAEKAGKLDWRKSTIEMLEELHRHYKYKTNRIDVNEYDYQYGVLLYKGSALLKDNVVIGDDQELKHRQGREGLVTACLNEMQSNEHMTREQCTAMLKELCRKNEELTDEVNRMTLKDSNSNRPITKLHKFNYGEIEKRVGRQLQLVDYVRQSSLKVLNECKNRRYAPGEDGPLFDLRKKIIQECINSIGIAKTDQDVFDALGLLKIKNIDARNAARLRTTAWVREGEGRLGKVLGDHMSKLQKSFNLQEKSAEELRKIEKPQQREEKKASI